MIYTSPKYPPIAQQKKHNFTMSSDCIVNTRDLNQYQHPSRSLKSSSKKSRCNKVQHVYHDHIFDPDLPLPSSDASSEGRKPRKGPRGGVTTPFPLKLHNLLESDQWSDIISWQPHGRCFVLHKPKDFLDEVMPHHFRQTKLTSFQRQLNLYGFCRLTSGRDKGGYYHELFLRGKPLLCQRMVRMRIKGTRIKAASSPETEPNFYAMPPALVSAHAFPEGRIVESQPINHPMTLSNPIGISLVDFQFSRPDEQTVLSSSPVCISYPASVSSSSLNSEDQRSCSSMLDIPNHISSHGSDIVLSESQLRAGSDVCNFEGKAFHYLESFVDSSFDVTNENFPQVTPEQSSVIEQCKYYDNIGQSMVINENISGFEV